MRFQLPLFGATPRARRACFFSLHPRDKLKKFSAYAPKAMTHFAAKYDLPIVEKPEDLAAFDTVFFSLHCFRDFYLVARMAHHKRKGQEWIAGGNACATPASVGWIMDYVWVGDCRASFARILAGERDFPSMYDARRPERLIRYMDEDLDTELIEMSKGCPRRCLFCIHPWRHRYQEAPQEVVEKFVRAYPKTRLGLMSNSSDVNLPGETEADFDEFEADGHSDKGRHVEAVSELLRQITTEGGANPGRGTQDGTPRTYVLRADVVEASILRAALPPAVLEAEKAKEAEETGQPPQVDPAQAQQQAMQEQVQQAQLEAGMKELENKTLEDEAKVRKANADADKARADAETARINTQLAQQKLDGQTIEIAKGIDEHESTMARDQERHDVDIARQTDEHFTGLEHGQEKHDATIQRMKAPKEQPSAQ